MTGPADRFRPLGRGPSFSLANKLERAAWRLAWLLLARWTPPAFSPWRRFLLRLFGAKVGSGAKVYGSVRIWLPRHLDLGEGVIVGPGADLYNQGRITIGAYSVVSQRAFLAASTHRTSDLAFELVLCPITLGRGCWVAAEAFVGPGVAMGDGAVLAARGALFEDAAELGVYRGNPATLIRQRQFAEPGS